MNERRLVRRFDDTGAAGSQSRSEGAHQQGDRRIPGDDDTGNTCRFTVHQRKIAGCSFQRSAKHRARQAAVIAGLGYGPHGFTDRFGPQFAVFGNDQFNDFVSGRFQPVGKFEQSRCPQARRGGPWRVEKSRSGDIGRLCDKGSRTRVIMPNDASISRIGALAEHPFARYPFAIDIMLCSFHAHFL